MSALEIRTAATLLLAVNDAFFRPKGSWDFVHQVLLHPDEVEHVQNLGSPKTSRNTFRIAINAISLGAASYTFGRSRCRCVGN